MKETYQHLQRDSILFLVIASAFILYRNFVHFNEDFYAPMYSATQYRLLSPTMRCCNNKLNSLGEKSLLRNIVFNLIRNLHVNMLK